MESSILNHTGFLSFSLIDQLLTEFKNISQDYEISFKIYKKILTVMIESLENVYKYRDTYENFASEKNQFLPKFSIEMNSHLIKLITSNPVKKEDIDVLKGKIDKVNNKSRTELKELYLETITNGEFSGKGGAGLGFIEMAKTSGNNLQYSFKPISDYFSLYTFIVTFEK